MSTIRSLICRNIKLFFKDKGMFLTSLITPLILLVLYATFLSNVYRDSFLMNIPDSVKISDSVIDGVVTGQLVSSLLAVSCVTVAFCSNFLMVQDKANGTIKDLRISPVSSAALSISYYVASFLSTIIICFTATAVCLVYMGVMGWYMSAADVLFLILDVVLLVLFGTALSSVINFFLSTQGQISAVGTIVSSGYGFICGAYMPLSQFSEGLQRVIMFLPGTYATSLMRNHTMRGALDAMADEGLPADVMTQMRDAVDCNLYFFDKLVSIPVMYLVVCSFVALLVAAYVVMNYVKGKDSK